MTAKIKLNAASGGGSISIQAPSSSSNNRVISLPDIADGTLLTSQSSLDSTKLSPAISAGITMADQWTITSSSNFTGSATIFQSNWARNPNSTYGKIGTGMTESSGLFTFPSTGIYLIIGSFSFYSISSALRYVGLRMQTSTDGMSSAINALDSYTSIGISNSFGAYAQVSDNILFDVTDTSTHKIRFVGLSITSSATYVGGNSSGMGSGVTFIRLGDT